VLKKCTLVLRVSARNPVILHAHFIGRNFEVKKEQKNFWWEQANLEDCRFKGRLTGNDFGEWCTDLRRRSPSLREAAASP
jgi:hypothetical protein